MKGEGDHTDGIQISIHTKHTERQAEAGEAGKVVGNVPSLYILFNRQR